MRSPARSRRQHTRRRGPARLGGITFADRAGHPKLGLNEMPWFGEPSAQADGQAMSIGAVYHGTWRQSGLQETVCFRMPRPFTRPDVARGEKKLLRLIAEGSAD